MGLSAVVESCGQVNGGTGMEETQPNRHPDISLAEKFPGINWRIAYLPVTQMWSVANVDSKQFP